MKFFVSLKTLAQNKFENKESAKTTSEKEFTKKKNKKQDKGVTKRFCDFVCFFFFDHLNAT